MATEDFVKTFLALVMPLDIIVLAAEGWFGLVSALEFFLAACSGVNRPENERSMLSASSCWGERKSFPYTRIFVSLNPADFHTHKAKHKMYERI